MLTVIGIMGVAFAFSMHLETQATRQFVATTQARYIAEAGITHARALLHEDRLGSRVDEPAEAWVQEAVGSDVDVDGSGTRNARWHLMSDAGRKTIGRYAWKITDEAGKVNLNTGQAHPSGVGLGAVNLTTLMEQAGMTRAAEVAEAIERYRYGEDGKPGVAGVDDNGDGAIDEPNEYQPLAPTGDDQRFEGMEDVARAAGLSADEARRLSQVATVYSWDLNVSVTGKARVNVNTATADELLTVLLDAGVEDPWQAAVNLADYVDPDFAMSRVTKSAQLLIVVDQGAVGGWAWSNEPVGHYASQMPDGQGQGLSWSVQVPTGSFRLRAIGLAGVKVGDVTVAGQFKSSVGGGESLGVFQLSGTLEVHVVNHETAGSPCAFRGIELVSEGAESGIMIRGVESVRFNELMVEPVATFDVSTATFDAQGSGWACPVSGSACTNSGVGQGRWTWTSSSLQPGRYYLRVFGTSAGQTVGEVRLDSTSKLLVHGERHPATLLVGSDGKISLTIGKTASEGTYYLKSISISVQPDGEYVELINLSNAEIDVGGWTIEGELSGGRQARLPSGSRIKAHGFLVAAVDIDDHQAGLAGNSIDARSAWEIGADVNAVQLEFPAGGPSPDDDWLKVSVPAGGTPRLSLRTPTGAVVDEVEYPIPLPTSTGFQSLEKGDPTVIVDKNHNGVDEGWYPSLRLYTPGLGNDNDGLKEVVGQQTIVHDPAKEVTVLNRPLGGVGEVAGLSSGTAWKPFSSSDLAHVVDLLTVEGQRLEAERHLVGEVGGKGGWEEKSDGWFEHADPAKADAVGRWQWAGLSDGRYRLSLYSCAGCAGEQFSVRWGLGSGALTDWSPPISSDAQGRVAVGQVAIGMDGTPTGTLALDVQCVSQSGICHFDRVQLDPQLMRIGPVNVNTAPLEVLRALPGMTDALAGRLIAGRPYGDQGQKGRGIGDLLLGSVLGSDEEEKLRVFRQLGHLLTTRSDVFKIISYGQALDADHPSASQRIETVVQR